MADFSNPPLPLFISTYCRWCSACQNLTVGNDVSDPTSITWPVADTAFYTPVFIPWQYPVKRVWWFNGSSVTTTTMDFGIYSLAGTLIYSTGNTTAAGASAPQYVTTSPDFIIGPGAYYFALTCSTTVANRGGSGRTTHSLETQRLGGILQQASARPLPASMSASSSSSACWPLCGITRTASGF